MCSCHGLPGLVDWVDILYDGGVFVRYEGDFAQHNFAQHEYAWAPGDSGDTHDYFGGAWAPVTSVDGHASGGHGLQETLGAPTTNLYLYLYLWLHGLQ